MGKPRRCTHRTRSREVKPEHYQERDIELEGWPVRLTSYKLGEHYIVQADNVSPGAVLARFEASTLEEAEAQAISKAKHLLSKTRRTEP
jgi:hypothetical protein